MKYGSVCTGVGTETLAWEPLGWSAEFFAEIDPYCSKILDTRWGMVPNLGDFSKINAKEYYGKLDLFVGGTPCQGFSLTGMRKGLDDSRSGLAKNYLEFIRDARPRWAVWENVPGVFSSWSGEKNKENKEWEETNDFDQFLAGIDECRYGYAWRVLDAQYVRTPSSYEYAVPQRRRRVFVVAYLGDWRPAAAVLFDSKSMSGHSAPGRKTGTGVARTLTASTGGSSGKETSHTFIGFTNQPLNALSIQGEIADGRRRNQNGIGISNSGVSYTLNTGTVHAVCYQTGNVFPTLDTTDGEKWGCNQWVDQGKAIIGVSETGHGWWIQSSTMGSLRVSPAVSQLVCINTGQAGFEVTITVCSTLNCNHEAPIICYEHHMQDSRAKRLNGCFPSISARAGTGGGNLPLVQCFGWNKSSHQPMTITTDISQTLQSSPCSNPAINFKSTVRRLTPLECERLMGFPDFHTLIPWKVSKKINIKKQMLKTAWRENYLYLLKHGFSKYEAMELAFTPDNHRYKACGNAMCVNVMRWLGERIQLVDDMIIRGI